MTELDIALSIDDQLYRKFEDLNRKFQEGIERFKGRERIREVVRRVNNVNLYHMKILEVHDTGEGLVIIVE